MHGVRLIVSPAPLMDDCAASRLRKMVEEHLLENLVKLKAFARDSGLPYFRLRAFMLGQGPSLRLDQANRLHRFLTGEPLGVGPGPRDDRKQLRKGEVAP